MTTKKEILELIGRFAIYMILIAGLIAGGVLIRLNVLNRPRYTDDTWKDVTPYVPPGSENYRFILDQHVHTNFSDGELTVRQNVMWHKAMGFNALVITDHGTIANKDEIAKAQQEFAEEMIIIQGIEWGNDRIHMNLIGINTWTEPNSSDTPEDQIKSVIKQAHDQNAVITVNHIVYSIEYFGMENHPTRDQLRDWGIDYIEIVNDDSLYQFCYDPASVPYCEANGIGQITGSDIHDPIGLGASALHGWTVLNASEFTEAAVMDQLRARKTSIIFDPVGIQDRGNYPDQFIRNLLKPWGDFGTIFLPMYFGEGGLNWGGISLFIVFFIGIFAVTEVYRFVQVRFWQKIHKNAT